MYLFLENQNERLRPVNGEDRPPEALQLLSPMGGIKPPRCLENEVNAHTQE